MCGVNSESFISEMVVAAVSNEKFFENMTAEEKVKSVAELYRTLYHQIVEHDHHHA
jgi:ABC-type Na+ transport system ATPase subunit NatA